MNSELEDILSECFKSDKLFNKIFLPDNFYGPFTSLHDEMYDLMENGGKFTCIAAPRGIGKTTTVRGKSIKNMLYLVSKFIPYVSKSFDAASLQTENIKRDLLSAPLIKKIFGKAKTAYIEDPDLQESFSKKSWVAYKTIVVPRGYTQQIRGLLWGNQRPDLFIIDDLEDDELIESEEYRKKIKIWFHSVLMKAISLYSNNWRIIYIDTLKHEDSLLADLLASDKWNSVRLSLCDKNLKSNVPEIMSDEEIKEQYDYHESEGILDVFSREYMNEPTMESDRSFKPKYYRPIDLIDLHRESNIEYVVICDPAKTVKMHSAESAVVVAGLDMDNNRIIFVDCISEKVKPDQLYNNMFDMVVKWNATTLAVEVTSLEEFIKQPIENEVVKRNIHVDLIWLQARGSGKRDEGKNKRIASLVPYYRQGTIWHVYPAANKLEEQLDSFPRSKKKDVMDCFAYIVQLTSIGQRYMTQGLNVNSFSYKYENQEEFKNSRLPNYLPPIEGTNFI